MGMCPTKEAKRIIPLSYHFVDSKKFLSLTNGRQESKFVQRIVEEIMNKLNRIPFNVAKHPVGLDSLTEDIKSLLEVGSGGVRAIGIHGIGGIGKTTLVKAVYNHISHLFEGSAFIANVREISSQRHGLVQLQETLLSEILSRRDFKVGNKDRGINLIKNRLCCKKVLIVVDDADSLEQLESLVGDCSWFGSGSRIVITTRDEHLLISHNVETNYKVKELSHEHALELFSWFAFKKPCPPSNYEGLSSQILNYAKGLPLALTVLGAYLCGRGRAEWISALAKLKKTPNKQIYAVLKISFDGLEEDEKAIFLDIACFFKGEDKDYVKMILDACDLHSDNGFGVLMDKSLITMQLNKLWMHDLLQEMGKEIVCQESPQEPGKRSRLWFHEDILHVLNQNTVYLSSLTFMLNIRLHYINVHCLLSCYVSHQGTNNIEGIKLDLPEPDNINGKAFAKMKRLRILVINNALVTDEIQYLSDELRLIDWPGYPSSTLPPNFHPRRLVSLNMSHSHIKHLWKGAKIFRDLKLVSFSCCEHLTEIPDMSMVPNLESLSIDNCKSLIRVHESVGTLNKLVTLNLMFCSNLNTLPTRFKLKSLRNLLLTGCSKLRKFPEIVENMEHLEEILLQGTAIKELPQSIEYLVGLKSLFLDSCQNLEHLPSSIQKLQYLTTLNLSYCSKLQELPKLPPNTKYLDISDCRSLESFTMLSSPSNVIAEDLSSFQQMSFINCHKLINEQVQFHLTNLFYNEGPDSDTYLVFVNGDFVLPGSKIPDWFHHQSTNGSINLEMASILYGKPAKLFLGAVIELEKGASTTSMFACAYEIFINDTKVFEQKRVCEALDSSHVWLSRMKCSHLMWHLNNVRYWNHLRISFRISEVSSKAKVRAVLKNCGFHICCNQEGYLVDPTAIRNSIG
ncbi:hypothetical protein AHAS_Ahas15G0373900 [Arachis hypogaea]